MLIPWQRRMNLVEINRHVLKRYEQLSEITFDVDSYHSLNMSEESLVPLMIHGSSASIFDSN